jgi:hypothetical protein
MPKDLAILVLRMIKKRPGDIAPEAPTEIGSKNEPPSEDDSER